MQAAIYRTLDGVAGLAGWRWLYIICGLMTLPTAATVAFVLPDYPSNTKGQSMRARRSTLTWPVWYLSEEEKEMAKRRCANRGVRPATGIIDLKTFKQIMSTWHVWLLVPTYCCYAWSVQSYGVRFLLCLLRVSVFILMYSTLRHTSRWSIIRSTCATSCRPPPSSSAFRSACSGASCPTVWAHDSVSALDRCCGA